MIGTQGQIGGLAEALFSKNRRAVLSLLYGHADEAFYLRQIVRASGGGVGAIQRELRQLVESGIIRRSTHGKQVYFQASTECPVFAELKSLLMKTAGLTDVLRTALAPLADHIDVAFVHGSIARGNERQGSDVDMMVVGDATFCRRSGRDRTSAGTASARGQPYRLSASGVSDEIGGWPPFP